MQISSLPLSWRWLFSTSMPIIPERSRSLTVNALSFLRLAFAVPVLLCGFSPPLNAEDTPSNLEVVISVADQRLALVKGGAIVRKFSVSTSMFGLGDGFGSYKTPLGRLRVCVKLGDDLPQGAVFKRRNFRGEVLRKNARGRDPIVTRILWLEGVEPHNKNARRRCIYIHGTPQERSIGKALSYGCVRMRSQDVVQVFDAVPIGTTVTIIAGKLPRVRNPEVFKSLVFGTGTRIRGRS
jgi:lipoprotein-anchoring transpeptidase ErfK/SrfK